MKYTKFFKGQVLYMVFIISFVLLLFQKGTKRVSSRIRKIQENKDGRPKGKEGKRRHERELEMSLETCPYCMECLMNEQAPGLPVICCHDEQENLVC